MKIGEFRAAVDSLNWNRRDLSGATRQEFVAMQSVAGVNVLVFPKHWLQPTQVESESPRPDWFQPRSCARNVGRSAKPRPRCAAGTSLGSGTNQINPA